jgi:hypothetical protein
MLFIQIYFFVRLLDFVAIVVSCVLAALMPDSSCSIASWVVWLI